MLRSIWQVTGRYSRKANSSAGLSLDVFENNRYTSRLARNFALKIHKICITGGPCAGKTTAIETLVERLMGEYCVIDVPELATIKIKSGQKLLVNGPPKEQSEATRNLIQEMMAFEDSYIQKAKNDPRDEAVVIFDRGVMDNLAYMGQPALDYFRLHKYLDLDTIRDSRYDMVIHMKSAADGAPEFYTLANNTARSESVDRAKELDREILKSWTGHRNHKIIGNEGDFNTKIRNVYNSLLAHLNLPTESTNFRKYLLDSNFSLESVPSDINRHSYKESVFFLVPNKQELPFGADSTSDVVEYLKVRQNAEHADSVRSTYCTRIKGGIRNQRIERKRNLSRQEFLFLLSSRVNSNLLPVTRDIEVFTYQNDLYSLEKVKVGGETLKFLRVSSVKKSDELAIPGFLNVGKEITSDAQYSTRQLAQPLNYIKAKLSQLEKN